MHQVNIRSAYRIDRSELLSAEETATSGNAVDVQVTHARRRPHDVGAHVAVVLRQARRLGIEVHHDHPMRGDGKRRADPVIWIRDATLSSAREHVPDRRL